MRDPLAFLSFHNIFFYLNDKIDHFPPMFKKTSFHFFLIMFLKTSLIDLQHLLLDNSLDRDFQS